MFDLWGHQYSYALNLRARPKSLMGIDQMNEQTYCLCRFQRRLSKENLDGEDSEMR